MLTLNVVEFAELQIDDADLDCEIKAMESLSFFSTSTLAEQRARLEREDEVARELVERKKRAERESVFDVLGGVRMPSKERKQGLPIEKLIQRQKLLHRKRQRRTQQDEMLAAG